MEQGLPLHAISTGKMVHRVLLDWQNSLETKWDCDWSADKQPGRLGDHPWSADGPEGQCEGDSDEAVEFQRLRGADVLEAQTPAERDGPRGGEQSADQWQREVWTRRTCKSLTKEETGTSRRSRGR